MINENFVLLGVFLQFIGGVGYLLDTLKGRVKPNKVTWFLWALAPLIAVIAEVKQGVGMLALTTFAAGFVPLLVFIASFFNKQAEWKISKIDYVCGSLSIVGLILWLVTKVGNIAILFSILADALAAVPTVIKAYREPETESSFVYIMGIVNSVIGLLVIRTWNFEHVSYPTYLLFIEVLLTFLITSKVGKIGFFPKKSSPGDR